MTISATASRITFACNGSTTVFPVPIQAYQASDLTVMLTAPASAGAGETTLTLNGQYTMAPSGTLQPPAWTMTTTTVYASGYMLQVFLNPQQNQQTQFVQGQAFPSLAVQTAVDRLTQMIQRQQDLESRSIQAPDGDVAPQLLLPQASARANQALMFDANGNLALGVPNSQTITTGLLAPFLALGVTAAETAALVTPTNLAYPQGDVRRYGAVGDGVTLDLAAVTAAFNVIIAAGQGSITFHPGDTYSLGNIGTTTPLINVTGLSNCTIYGNGATIKTNMTASVIGAVIQITNPSNVRVMDLNFFDSGFDQSQSFKCAHAFFLTASAACSGFTMVNCQASKMGSLLGVYRTSAVRLTNISLYGCRALNCYYGVNFQQQGDDVTISGLYCLNPNRAYYPYGITGHSVDIHVVNDGTNGVAGSTFLCPIKRYDFDTKEIKLRLSVSGDTSIWGALVGLIANQTSGGTPLFDSIDIDLRLAAATVTGSSVGFPVQFQDISNGTTNGGPTVNPTSVQWNRITLRGDFGAWPVANINNPVSILSAPTLSGGIGILSLEGGMSNILMQAPQAYPGFQIRVTPDTYVYSKTGDLTAAPIFIDLTKYQGMLFGLRIKLYLEAQYNLGSTNNSYREIIVLGSNSAGTVTVGASSIIHSLDTGTVPTVTVAASGAGVNISITAFNNSLAQARMHVEHLSKFL